MRGLSTDVYNIKGNILGVGVCINMAINKGGEIVVYIIIGLVLVYIAIPFLIALSVSGSNEDIPKEWREAFKVFASAITIAIVIVAVLSVIVYGLVNLLDNGVI